MPTVSAVTQALLQAGECRATKRTGGFQVDARGAGCVIVRWCAPEHQRGSDASLGFIEEYARLLRDVGVCALVTTEAPEPRVLCLPGVALGQRLAALQEAS